jgi:hypothetical protein
MLSRELSKSLKRVESTGDLVSRSKCSLMFAKSCSGENLSPSGSRHPDSGVVFWLLRVYLKKKIHI